jgi:hypothetical protein
MSDTNQFGIPALQRLVSIPLDEEGNPRLDALAPYPVPDDWTPPAIVPLVKLDPPTLAAGEACDPILVWHEDRVERDWQVRSQTADEARKTWPNAAAFLGEFSMPELAAISLSTDPTVAALRLLLASWPSDVWSDDPRIIMGLGALVSAGIIDETRSAEIVAKD